MVGVMAAYQSGFVAVPSTHYYYRMAKDIDVRACHVLTTGSKAHN